MDSIPPQTSDSVSAPRPGWWSRNWKWFVPTGCLAIVAMIAAFVAMIVIIVFGALKSTDVYKNAVARAKADPAVIDALGTPVKEGMFLSGSTSTTGPSGEAELSIPISGPKGEATIYVVAKKSAGEWTYERLVVEIAQTKQRIELMESDEALIEKQQ